MGVGSDLQSHYRTLCSIQGEPNDLSERGEALQPAAGRSDVRLPSAVLMILSPLEGINEEKHFGYLLAFLCSALFVP